MAKINFFSEKIAKVPTLAKKPLTKWSTVFFYDTLPQGNGDGVAYLTGSKSSIESGEVLYALDFDVKHDTNGDVITRFFSLLPEQLEAKLHKHSTPSGGLHILYFAPKPNENRRCSVLAKSYATAENPRGAAIIEFKGEGGIITVPPTPNYVISKGFEYIPILNVEEDELIVNIARGCSLYKEEKRIASIPKPLLRDVSEYWNISPIDAFNASADVPAMLEGEGWQYLYSRGDILHFAHPNKRERLTSATFHNTKKFFYVFSTNTQLPEGKGLSPFALFSHLKHRGDMKAAYDAIKGEYGQKKPYTQRIRSNMSKSSIKPNNFYVQEEKEESGEVLMYGEFWEEKGGKPSKINHSKLMITLKLMGYCKYAGTLRKKDGNILKKCEVTSIRQDIEKHYGGGVSMVPTLANTCLHTYFDSVFFPDMVDVEKSEIIKDNRFEKYLQFNNCVIKVTKDGANVMQYSDVDFEGKYFLSEKIINYSYKAAPSGFLSKGEDFVNKAIVGDSFEKAAYTREIIGYLAHSWKSSSTSYIVVAPEPNANEMDGGGAGKDLTFKLIALAARSLQISAENFKDGRVDDNIYQSMQGGESLVNITDLPARHDITQYKALASEDVTVKKLFKDKIILPSEIAPKLYLSTNYAVQCNDGGVKRRLKYLEFTGFFNDKSGNTVRSHYGGEFPEKVEHLSEAGFCWSADDISGWYWFLAQCCQKWLQKIANNEDIKCMELSGDGALKQVRHFSEAGYLISEYLYNTHLDYILEQEGGFVTSKKLNELIDAGISANDIDITQKPSPIKVSASIQKYFSLKGYEVELGSKKVAGTACKGRFFKKKGVEAKPVANYGAMEEIKANNAKVVAPPPSATPRPSEIYTNPIFQPFYDKEISALASETPTVITEKVLVKKAKSLYPNAAFDYSAFVKYAIGKNSGRIIVSECLDFEGGTPSPAITIIRL